MKSLFLVTSVINIPNIPLSYTNVRSVFTANERFEQTKKTIQTIRNKIPDVCIYFVEYSDLTHEQTAYLKENTDYFINFYETDKNLSHQIFNVSKALGEGSLTICAIQSIIDNQLIDKYDAFFKISGRYSLNDHFNYQNFENDMICLKLIENDLHNISTCLYKLPMRYLVDFFNFLKDLNTYQKMVNCVGYEILFSEFIHFLKQPTQAFQNIGYEGYVAVDGSYSSG